MLVPDYPIHVISSGGMVQREWISACCIRTEAGVGFLQHQEDKEGLKRYVEENRAVFSRLSSNAALFLAASAHETRLLKGLNRKEEHYDMCRALDEWYADGVSEGEKLEKETEFAKECLLRFCVFWKRREVCRKNAWPIFPLRRTWTG